MPDYYEIIRDPMDLFTMMNKIDLHKYQTAQEFLKDIDLICSNALEYNPDRDPQGMEYRCLYNVTCISIASDGAYVEPLGNLWL